MSIVKPAAILLIICAIVSGILGYVNDVTTAPIAAADKKTTEESMNAVLADAQWGETVEVNYETGDDNGTVITSYTPGLNPDGSIKGYAVSVTTKGFSAGLKLMYGIDANSNDDNGTDEGTITGLSVVDNSNETPGLGANSSKPEWLIHQNGRRHPETDEVGKRIQFGAEFGRSFEHARHATVQHVKKGSQKNADDGFSPQSHNRITHGSDAGAQSQRGDDIGGDFAKRQRSQFLLQQIVVEFFHYLITPLTAAADDERLAITVSPAVMI